jgi:hypothetical protein
MNVEGRCSEKTRERVSSTTAFQEVEDLSEYSFLPGIRYPIIPCSFRRCIVDIVVKNTISKEGSFLFSLFATDKRRVKCPNPTPFVGNMTMQEVFGGAKCILPLD